MVTPAAVSTGGLLGSYYPNTSWSGSPSLVRVDPTVDFDWSFGHPIPVSDFSVLWSGSITIPTAGTYTFALDSDDGSSLAIGGTTTVNDPIGTATNSVTLAAGTYPIIVKYFECCGGPAYVHLSWMPPGSTSFVVVPQAVLYSNAGPPSAQTYGNCLTGWTNCPYELSPEPVNTASGNYVSQVADLALPGRGLPFTFTRTYNSLDSTAGSLGPSWTHGFAARLVLNADGSATFVSDDGSQLLFASNGSGGFVTPSGGLGTLRTITGGYEATRHDQIRYDFDTTGRLSAEIDRNGNTLSFGYTSGNLTTITDTVGRTITLAYDASNRLTKLTDPIGRSVSYAYDTSGHLATVTDVRAGVTSYGYDSSGRLTTITDQNGHVLVTNAYGSDGRVASQIDARGNKTTFAFDPTTGASTMTDARGGAWIDVYLVNKLMSAKDPLGNTTSYTYDANFNVGSVTDPRGNTTQRTYDSASNLLSRTVPSPLSYVERFTYDAQNNVLTATDGRGNTTSNTYDSAGNLVKVTAPDGTFTTFTYDSHGLVLSTTDPRGKTTTFGYDPQANRNRITSPLGEVSTMTYDAAGRMLSLVDPRGNVSGANPVQYTTTFAYDAADHVLTATDPLGDITTTIYDPAGNRSAVRDANNHVTTYAHDASNHLVSVTDPAGKVTAYAYDATSNLTSRTDANTHVTTYAYDLAGRLTSTADPAAHATTLTYDPDGNIATRTDANGKTTTYSYDVLNRQTGITYAATTTPAVTFAYDGDGNRTSMTDGAGTETYAYDPLNRPTSVTRGSDVLRYAYDAAGNLTSRTYPDATVTTYAFDDDSRLASATSGGKTTTYTYDPASEVLTAATPDGFTARSTYDPAGRLLEVANTSSAGTLSRSTYVLDPVGNRLSMTTTRDVQLYMYDALNRLTKVCYNSCTLSGGGTGSSATALAAGTACYSCGSGGISPDAPPTNGGPSANDIFANWTYDAVGNRLTETNYLGGKTSTYDPADRLTSVAGPGTGTTSYSYDANGNETSAGTTTYTYNLADRLVSAKVGSTTQTYTYAGDGVRLSASTGSQPSNTTGFVVDRSFALPTVVAERDGSGKTQATYTYGLDLLTQTTPTKGPYWYHHDGLGSVVNITNASGSDLAWWEYQPYGVLRSFATTSQAPVNPFLFTGQYQDGSTGLYHLRARQYDPGIGRFLAVDPIRPTVGGASESLYVYADNQPTDRIDPTGRDSQGACVTFNYGVGPVQGIVELCTVKTSSGQGGITLTVGGGAGANLDVSAGAGYQGANADTLSDLAGPFGGAGGSAVVGVGAYGNIFGGAGRCPGKIVNGYNAGVAVGGGASASASGTRTFVFQLTGPADLPCSSQSQK